MDKSLIFLLLLLPSLAFAQTHTMPGNNVVPGGANLTIKNGGSIIADPGSTIVGFGGGGGTTLTAGSGIDITSDVISVDKTLFTLQPVNTAPTLDSIMLMYNPLLDQMQQLAFSDFAANLSINSVTDPVTGKKLFFGTSALTADRHANQPDADTIGVIPMSAPVSNQYITFISGGGIQNHAQPSISNLSDAGQLAGWAAITPAAGVSAFLTAPSSSAFRVMITDENNPDGLTAKVIMANGSLSIAAGKTFTSSNTLTLQGTDGSALNMGVGGTLGSAAFTNTSAYQPADPDLLTWATITPTAGVGTWIGTPTSANLRAALSDENGTGAALFSGATTPDFTTGFTIGTAAGSGKVMKGNGTNFVPSTETYAAPGTSGNIMVSDGTNWTSSAHNNHAVYAAASPPTVDVGVFTISKTGIDFKTAATTNIFVVPSGRAFVCLGATAVVTSVTTRGQEQKPFRSRKPGQAAQ